MPTSRRQWIRNDTLFRLGSKGTSITLRWFVQTYINTNQKPIAITLISTWRWVGVFEISVFPSTCSDMMKMDVIELHGFGGGGGRWTKCKDFRRDLLLSRLYTLVVSVVRSMVGVCHSNNWNVLTTSIFFSVLSAHLKSRDYTENAHYLCAVSTLPRVHRLGWASWAILVLYCVVWTVKYLICRVGVLRSH